MDAREQLEEILRDSPVPRLAVLDYLSHAFSAIGFAAELKRLQLCVEELNIGQMAGILTNSEIAGMHRAIANYASGMVIPGDYLVQKNFLTEDEFIWAGRLAVEHHAILGDWSEVYTAVLRTQHGKVSRYAADLSGQYAVPPETKRRLAAGAAVLDGKVDDAIRIAEESGDYQLLRDLPMLYGLPERERETIKGKLWAAAREGKLPLEEALEMAKSRGDLLAASVMTGLASAMAELRLLEAQDPLEKAKIANKYGIGEPETYIIECAATVIEETAKLRGMLSGNPSEVVESAGHLLEYESARNYRRCPEQSAELDYALRDVRILKTDALLQSGKFKEALSEAVSCKHPKTEWLYTLVKQRESG